MEEELQRGPLRRSFRCGCESVEEDPLRSACSRRKLTGGAGGCPKITNKRLGNDASAEVHLPFAEKCFDGS